MSLSTVTSFCDLFIYTIFQEGDIFSSTASLPYGPLNMSGIFECAAELLFFKSCGRSILIWDQTHGMTL